MRLSLSGVLYDDLLGLEPRLGPPGLGGHRALPAACGLYALLALLGRGHGASALKTRLKSLKSARFSRIFKAKS